jgi:hypothetical protein
MDVLKLVAAALGPEEAREGRADAQAEFVQDNATRSLGRSRTLESPRATAAKRAPSVGLWRWG